MDAVIFGEIRSGGAVRSTTRLGRASLNALFRDGAVTTFQLGNECKRVDGFVKIRRNGSKITPKKLRLWFCPSVKTALFNNRIKMCKIAERTRSGKKIILDKLLKSELNAGLKKKLMLMTVKTLH